MALNPGLMVRHRVYVAALVTVLVLALAVPAVGGPSLGRVTRTAKKALGLAKKADRRAKSASRLATTANGNAGRALTQANAATAAVGSISGIGPWAGPTNTVPVGEAVTSVAVCPAGTRVVSGGGFANTSEGIIASQASSDRTGWYVLTGESTTPGTVQAVAYCARTGALISAGLRHRSWAYREAEMLARQYATRLR